MLSADTVPLRAGWNASKEAKAAKQQIPGLSLLCVRVCIWQYGVLWFQS